MSIAGGARKNIGFFGGGERRTGEYSGAILAKPKSIVFDMAGMGNSTSFRIV